MTVVLVLVMFLIFVVADYIVSRGKAPQLAVEKPAKEATPAILEGFKVTENVRYHPGHAWCQRERKHLARVGVDEFAAAIVGPVEKIDLPKTGQWIRQGQKAWAFSRNGEKVDMVSPIEGEVIEINPDVVKDPTLLRKDPYGTGWLMMVHVPDEENTGRNLLPAGLVKSWLRSAVEKLYAAQPQLAGATAADGGLPVDDLAAGLTGQSWRELASDFFLTR